MSANTVLHTVQDAAKQEIKHEFQRLVYKLLLGLN